MNKETEKQSPCTPNEALTHEQRNRIYQNFEAAKTLRARKRLRCCSNKSIDTSNWRVPLKELPTNIVSPDSLDDSSRADKKSRGHRRPQETACADSFAEVRNYHNLNIMPCAGDFVEERSSSPKHSLVEKSCTNDFSTLPSLLDEDFDACILREIDALCYELSAKTVRSKGFGGDDEKHIGSAKKEDAGIEQAEEFLNMGAEYSKYMKCLNHDQLEAASCDVSVPLMVVAGPGSGKTSTMVGRILMLLSEGMVPSHILAMTFTTAAASEMRERIGAIAGKKIAKELTISTFHSFSLQLCRSHAEKPEIDRFLFSIDMDSRVTIYLQQLGRTADFLIYGHAQQRRAIIEAVRLLESKQSKQNFCAPNFKNGTNSPLIFKDKSKKWLKFVTQAKASGETADDCRKHHDEIGAMILSNYNDTLKACNALDYHDLISESVKLLNDYPEVMKECQKSWGAIIIDEFQDTSAMQYKLLRLLAGHGRITVVGDEDQAIFGFNGADLSGFDAFRKDFSNYKEIRLKKNYRSTRCIVEASASLIRNNSTSCLPKEYLTDNCSGQRITIKECQNEDAQSAFIVDKVMEMTSDHSDTKCSFGSIAILYRRQVTGKVFQSAFRSRKIPFNVHGVAFYRKKVIKAIIAMLKTTLPGCDDGPFRQVFKTFLPFEKEEKKKVIEHVDRISTIHKCSFMLAASDVFGAKISGTLKRSQLSQGRRVLRTIEMISKLVEREESISAVVSCVGNLLPQRYLLEKRAIVDAEGGKFLNEDNDVRSVIQYLLDDVTKFLSTMFVPDNKGTDSTVVTKGCLDVLKAFIDHISEREKENFRSRRRDNEDSVTLTTIHQSKGLEWDIVFIVKVNESEVPLLHEHHGIMKEIASSVEEERRLLYVAMTRARKKLYILYVIMDSNWQMLEPSRFLREIPCHLQDVQVGLSVNEDKMARGFQKDSAKLGNHGRKQMEGPEDLVSIYDAHSKFDEAMDPPMVSGGFEGSIFLKRFNMEDRAFVSNIFHQWAKKQAFQDPKRLLLKVKCVIDERLRSKKSKQKDVMRALKSLLSSDEAFQFAEYVLRWEQIVPEKRALLLRERQEHFQKLRMENAMTSAAPTSKQIAYLHTLGCTTTPTSRLEASHLIEQYKSL